MFNSVCWSPPAASLLERERDTLRASVLFLTAAVSSFAIFFLTKSATRTAARKLRVTALRKYFHLFWTALNVFYFWAPSLVVASYGALLAVSFALQREWDAHVPVLRRFANLVVDPLRKEGEERRDMTAFNCFFAAMAIPMLLELDCARSAAPLDAATIVAASAGTFATGVGDSFSAIVPQLLLRHRASAGKTWLGAASFVAAVAAFAALLSRVLCVQLLSPQLLTSALVSALVERITRSPYENLLIACAFYVSAKLSYYWRATA